MSDINPNIDADDPFFKSIRATPRDEVSPTDGLSVNPSVAVRGPDDGRAILLRPQQDNDTGTGEERANIYWYSDAGGIISVVGADSVDNEHSIYTSDVGVAGTSLEKRLDIEAGVESTLINLTAPKIDGTQHDAQLRFLENGSIEDAPYLWFRPTTTGNSFRVAYSGSGAAIAFNRPGSGKPPVQLFQNPIAGLREVSAQPSASDLAAGEWAFTADRDGSGTAAWLFREESGTAHYFDTDGTL